MILQSVEQCRVFQALHGDTVFPRFCQDSMLGQCLQRMILMNSRLFY